MSTRTIAVASEEELNQRVSSYVKQGFTAQLQTATQAVLVRPKKFSIPVAVLGFLFCVVGLVVYTIYYAMQRDEVVEILVK